MREKNWYNVFVVIVLVLLGIWLYRRNQEPEIPVSDETEIEARVNEFLDSAGFELPANVDRANLNDVTGGDSTGVATRNSQDTTTDYTILAALPDLESGWYEGWLTDEDESNPVSLGNLRIAKGGYIVDTSNSNWPEKSRVIVTIEAKADSQPEDLVLEGSF